MLKRLSIKRKLILLIIVIFTFSILITVIYSTISSRESLKNVSSDITEIINNNHASKIKTELEKGISMLITVSEILQIEKQNQLFLTKKENILLTQNYLNLNKEITHLFILPAKKQNKQDFEATNSELDSLQFYGLTFYNSEKETKLGFNNAEISSVDFSKLEAQNSDNNILISDPFNIYIGETDKTVISIVKPIYSKNQLIGVAGINFSLSGISEIINTTSDYMENSKSMLLTKNKNIVFVSGEPHLSVKNIVNTEELTIYNDITKYKSKTRKNTGAFKKFTPKNTKCKWEIITTTPTNVITDKFAVNIYFSIFIACLILTIGLLTIIYFIKKSFLPLSKILNISGKISKGEFAEIKVNNNNDEFEKIFSEFNNISSKLRESVDTNMQIANGNYDVKIKEQSKEDLLSISINKIAKNLKDAELNTKIQEKNTSKQLWMRKGRFEIAEAERKSEKNISDLTLNILKSIINYTGALLGGIYLYDSEKKIIELTASFAYGNKKNSDKIFRPGEGLVGTCVQEKKTILLNQIPDDYIKIESGLGSGTPANISIIPVFYQNKINSVIELAFIKQPEDYEIEFIERLGDNIGAWIDASIINTKTSKLLELSKTQTKELAEKEHELNTKVEELENIQAKTAIQNAEYKSIMNAVNHTVMTVEYTLDGIVIKSNEIYEDIMGFKSEDIKGINVLELVKDQMSDLNDIINKVAEGIPVKKQVKRYTKSGKEKWLSATYTPYYNKDGKISRVLFFAHDITKMKSELDLLKDK